VGTAAVTTTRYQKTFHGQPEQIAQVRHQVAAHLNGHPVTDDAVLIVSELASNAVTHSDSAGDFFTVSVELHKTYCYIEIEDAGGEWHLKLPDESRPHGFDVVDALAGPDNWSVEGDEKGRVAWCRLELPTSGGGQ
jgi:serine/threonine-protein kinase RsbW